MAQETQKIWSLYRIINLINSKVYIGQTQDITKRWSDHRRAVELNKPTQIVHHAMIKYGLDNFVFEVIAGCINQEDANETETLLVKQYDSFIKNGNGYNVTLGGMNAPKTEAWFQAMRRWRDSLTPKERVEISKKQSEGMKIAYQRVGNWNLGSKRTDEQRANLSTALKARDHKAIYNEQVRQKMSEAHLGYTDSKETKQKKSRSTAKVWENRVDYSNIKCQAPGCEISGKAKYKIINGTRYCNKHGLRMLRHNSVDKLPIFRYDKNNPMPDEVRQKCGAANIDKIAHNRIIFTPEQIKIIISDARSSRKVAKDFGVTEKVIIRVRKENES